MGGFFGAVRRDDAISDVFFGTDYHSHLGTRRAGMAVFIMILMRQMSARKPAGYRSQ